MSELLPCPFGCNAVHDQSQVHVRDVGLGKGKAEWRVCCDYCSTKGPTAVYKADAVQAWNQRSALAALRAAPPAPALDEAREREAFDAWKVGKSWDELSPWMVWLAAAQRIAK